MGNFYDNLKDLLMERNMNIRQLSRESGIDHTNIYYWFNHDAYPTVATLIKLCTYFECSMDYILGRDDARRYTPFKEVDFVNNFKRMMKINETNAYRLDKEGVVSNSRTSSWLYQGMSPTLEGVIKLADYFGCSVDELLGVK